MIKINHKNLLKAELNSDQGVIKIQGKSIMEDSCSFYKTLIDWIEEYKEHPHKQTTVNLYIEYFNTLSSKYLHTLFSRLNKMHNSGESSVALNWHYEADDEEMKYTGERFKELFNMPVHLIETDEFDFCSN